MCALDLHPPSGWGLINPSPPRGRNSPDRPPQSSGGAPDRPEELTRGVEIPSQLGGFASTRWPGRTGPVGYTPTPRQVDHRSTARTAWIAGYRQASSAPSGKALRVPRSPRLVVRGRAAKRVSDVVDDVGPRVEGPEVRRQARTGQCEGTGTGGQPEARSVTSSTGPGTWGEAASHRVECPAETLPREGPRRSGPSRLPPPSAAANR